MKNKELFQKVANMYDELRNSASNTGRLPNNIAGWKNLIKRNPGKSALVATGVAAAGAGAYAMHKKKKSDKED